MRKRWTGEADQVERFEVWADNWRAFAFFSMSATQWRRDAMGHLAGLDYSGVIALFTSYRIPARQHGRLLEDMRLIEAGALEATREKATDK